MNPWKLWLNFWRNLLKSLVVMMIKTLQSKKKNYNQSFMQDIISFFFLLFVFTNKCSQSMSISYLSTRLLRLFPIVITWWSFIHTIAWKFKRDLTMQCNVWIACVKSFYSFLTCSQCSWSFLKILFPIIKNCIWLMSVSISNCAP